MAGDGRGASVPQGRAKALAATQAHTPSTRTCATRSPSLRCTSRRPSEPTRLLSAAPRWLAKKSPKPWCTMMEPPERYTRGVSSPVLTASQQPVVY